MIIKIGDKEHNTECSDEPVMCVFRQDELWNIMVSLMQNAEMSRFAVMPYDWDKDKKKEWMESVETPETPEAIKKAILKLKGKLFEGLKSDGVKTDNVTLNVVMKDLGD